MFENCKSLTSIDLSGFETLKVKEMRKMFKNCDSLKSIDLSSFNIAQCKNINSMFEGCHSLTSIDLSSFDDNNLSNINNIFKDCPSLEYIDISSIKWINKGQTTISYFQAKKGVLIISLDLYSNLESKPKESWNVTTIDYINNYLY